MNEALADHRRKANTIRLVGAAFVALLFLLPADHTDRSQGDVAGPSAPPVMAGGSPGQASAESGVRAPVAGQPVLDDLACVNWN